MTAWRKFWKIFNVKKDEKISGKFLSNTSTKFIEILIKEHREILRKFRKILKRYWKKLEKIFRNFFVAQEVYQNFG